MRDGGSFRQNAVLLGVVLVCFGIASFGVSFDAMRYGLLVIGGMAAVFVVLGRARRQRRTAVERADGPLATTPELLQKGRSPVTPNAPSRRATDTEVLRHLLAQTQKAVGFQPVFPPKHPMQGLTFLGGNRLGRRV